MVRNTTVNKIMAQYKWYCLLVTVRLISVMIPQSGYIHPDEFFQTTEIIAGDILEIDVYRPWEFNSSNPIRSIVLPYAVFGIPFKVQKRISSCCSFLSESYLSLVLPRILTALFSLVTDYVLFKLCKYFYIDAGKALLLLSSSYVTLIFLTRTFTNSYETLLFSVLIYLVYTEHENYKYLAVNKSVPSESKKLKKDTKCGKNSPYKEKSMKTFQSESRSKYNSSAISMGIGITVVLGIFNRPTFVAFAVIPVLFWLYTCFMMKKLIRVIVITSITVLAMFIMCVIIDTLYFHFDEISGLFLHMETCVSQQLPDNFSCFYTSLQEFLVVTPWNFLRYNVRTDNLAEHGIHPRYLHFTANMVILYGPAYIVFILMSTRNIVNFIRYRNNLMGVLLSCMICFPVFILSLFPHQEPRFLIPLLSLVMFLYAKFSIESGFWQLQVISHLFFNIPLFILFGFLHQGGVVPCLGHIQSGLNLEQFTFQDRFIFYHTYMPPRHLLHIRKNFKNPIIDLQGIRMEQLKSYFNKYKNITDEKSGSSYLILPGTLVDTVKKELSDNFSVSFYRKFCCHLTMEDPPNINSLLSNISIEWSLTNLYHSYSNFMNQTSLYMFIIDLKTSFLRGKADVKDNPPSRTAKDILGQKQHSIRVGSN
ncbi:hypothetical protein KUTeg_013233 [Tegillarca granosa]|uniref:Mannosyltransferase n=1 Tax=Tegillarca granosa TaxID=220873 RepID=A0ABQ9ET35_TEGGR|nr:hypothetical protein KUTeg_013233 [Tegillarca granosa]